MIIPRFVTNKLYQALFVASGVFIGVNNYDLISSTKERLVEEMRVKTIDDKKITYLEELITLKENETNTLYRTASY